MGSKRMPGMPGMLAVAVFPPVGLWGNPGSAMPGSICKKMKIMTMISIINYQGHSYINISSNTNLSESIFGIVYVKTIFVLFQVKPLPVRKLPFLHHPQYSYQNIPAWPIVLEIVLHCDILWLTVHCMSVGVWTYHSHWLVKSMTGSYKDQREITLYQILPHVLVKENWQTSLGINLKQCIHVLWKRCMRYPYYYHRIWRNSRLIFSENGKPFWFKSYFTTSDHTA